MNNAILEEIYRTGYALDSDGNRHSILRSGIPFDQGMAIYSLISKTKPLFTLEVGMAYGLSAMFACQAHADNNIGGVHTAIDPAQSEVFHSLGLHNVQRAGLAQHLRFFEEPSYAALPRLAAAGEHFGFIFIDGMHTFDFAMVDFFFADLLLDVGAFLMFDDLWMPSVRKVVDFVLTNRRYSLETEWIWNPQHLYQRMWHFASTPVARKIKMQTALKHQLQRPLDFSAVTYASKGSLKYQVLHKAADDDRAWNYHKPF